MSRKLFADSVALLQDAFSRLDWALHDAPDGRGKMFRWPGRPEEEIIVCAHQSRGLREPFHTHDFFFFNYTYKGSYECLSERPDRRITVGEGEIYAGQPAAAHALLAHDDRETVIIGLLIQKRTFFHALLPLLTTGFALFDFLLGPAAGREADAALHFKVKRSCLIHSMIESMVIEYASPRPDTQNVLKPMALAFLLMAARYAPQPASVHDRLCDRMTRYIATHVDTVTLQELAEHFPYHPNYISGLLARETGERFTEIRTRLRLEKALLLLEQSTLAVEEIARLLGYQNNSNFYRDFRRKYGLSPREFAKRRGEVGEGGAR